MREGYRLVGDYLVSPFGEEIAIVSEGISGQVIIKPMIKGIGEEFSFHRRDGSIQEACDPFIERHYRLVQSLYSS